MDLSLRDLGCSGVSAPMLSQVERGGDQPHLQVARRIAAGLGAPVAAASLDEDGAVTIVRRDERRGASRVTGAQLRDPDAAVARPARRALAHAGRGAVTGGPGDPPMHEPGGRGPR